MSLFNSKDYAQENKQTRPKNARVSKKTKLPTQNKTKNHKCSKCESRDAILVKVSEKEKQWLCQVHINQFNAQFNKEKPHFIRASQLSIKE